MSPAQPPGESGQKPGELLADLDRRQDDVLAQLDALQSQIDSVLHELGVTSLDYANDDLDES